MLARAREKKRLSQRELAARLKRPHSVVGMIESHQRQVNVPEFIAIAEALDMKPGGAVPLSLAATYPQWITPWDALRQKHGLISPDLEAFVGA